MQQFLQLFEQKIKTCPFTFIDLFAGIGGIRLGMESVGGKCVFSSEWDKFAQQTYEVNFHEIPKGDITKINERDIPPFDVLCAGFPCQPFSMAGLKKGFQDTRGTLFFDIARIINHHHPKVVFLENVKNFKNHNKGHTFNTIKRILEDLGYTVFYKILNAKNFGLPQNRERIFILAFLGKTNFIFPDGTFENTCLGDILETEVDNKYTISDKLWAGHKRRKAEHRAKGNGFGYKLFNEKSAYTSTISARYYKDGSEILVEQLGKNPRKITPREAMRLQGFPETYVMPVSDNQAYKQIGNSVAVSVIKAIALNMINAMVLIDDNKKSRNTDINIEVYKKAVSA